MSLSLSRFTRRLLVASLSLCVALVCVEGGLRFQAHRQNQELLQSALSKPLPPLEERRVGLIDLIQMSSNANIVYELRPGIDRMSFKDRPTSTNSHGFRCAEQPREPGPDTVTIVAIGDSILFGHGVGDGEQYTARLEQSLNERWPQKTWRVINTGVPGYNTVQEVETLITKGLAFRPDLVLWDIVGNDLKLPVYLNDKQDPLDPGRSYLVDFVRSLSGARPDSGPAPGGRGFRVFAGRDPGFLHVAKLDITRLPEHYHHLIGWKPCLEAVGRLVEVARKEGFPVVAFTTIEDRVSQTLMDRAREAGFPVISLWPELVEWVLAEEGVEMTAEDMEVYSHTALVVSPTNLHPSPLQHEMAAAKILDGLVAAGLIEELLAD